jgi:hypothetical protein
MVVKDLADCSRLLSIPVNHHVRRILRRFASSQITTALQIAAALQMAAVLRAALLSWAARDWAA